jgi:hypothetical protein
MTGTAGSVRVSGRMVALYVLHLVAATFGPAGVESLLWSIIGRPSSISATEGREWFLSIITAAAIAYFVYEHWPTVSAMWVWVLPVAFLLLRVLVYQRTPHPTEINIWQHFFYPDCSKTVSECQDFLLATVLSVRALSYSLMAGVLRWKLNREHLNGPATEKR